MTSSIMFSWNQDNTIRLVWIMTSTKKESIVKIYSPKKTISLSPTNQWQIKGSGYLLQPAFPKISTEGTITIVEQTPTTSEIESSIELMKGLETF